MKTIDKLSFVPLLALLLFAGSCEKDGGVFMRENDAIACDCTEQSISQNVLCDGEWVADCGDVGWIAITPERGSGNGKDYGFFTLNIQYNSGAERTATVHLVYDGAAYPITVTQGACEFAYGEPRVEGNLFRNIESTATLRLPYVCASGRESVEISCTITGVAADGLSVTKQVYTGFAKGSGELTIPVEGAATRAGAVAFELFADGVSVGSCRANVISDPDAVPEGLPVGWNFYALGMTGTAPRGSEWDYSWTTDAIHPATDTNPLDAHRLLPTAGNENAYLTASGVVSDNGNYTFNPGIQIKGRWRTITSSSSFRSGTSRRSTNSRWKLRWAPRVRVPDITRSNIRPTTKRGCWPKAARSWRCSGRRRRYITTFPRRIPAGIGKPTTSPPTRGIGNTSSR